MLSFDDMTMASKAAIRSRTSIMLEICTSQIHQIKFK